MPIQAVQHRQVWDLPARGQGREQRGAAWGAGARVTPIAVQLCPPRLPWVVPSSQADGVRPHICSAAVTVLVFIPIPSSTHGPGVWDSPCYASPRLLCQHVLGLLSWGSPGAYTSRDPRFPSETQV